MLENDKFQIIKTKTLPPHKRGKQFCRVNEKKILDDITESQLCAVIAPAGYGKTNILAKSFRHLSALGFHVGWLSLDTLDNDLYRFLSYFLAALKEANAIKREWRDITLQAQMGDDGDHLLSSLIDEIADLETDVYFILDGFHNIKNSLIHHFIVRLINYGPSNLHLILGSRKKLDFNYYQNVSGDEYTEIGKSHLQLSLVDAQNYFRECCEIDLPPEDIERWHRQVEGWIFPLKLAGISIKQKSGLQVLKNLVSDTNISDYLTEEILANMPEPASEFIKCVSIPDIFSMNSAVYITQNSNAADILNEIEQQNIFVESLSGSGKWYQLHPLFRGYLQERLKIESPRKWLDLHRRSREWFESNDMPSYAIKHAIEAGDSDLIGDLLEDSCNELLVTCQYMELVRWSEVLSDEEIFARPKLCFALAFDYIITHDFQRGRYLMGPLTSTPTANSDLGEFSGGVPVLLGLDASFRDNVDESLRYCSPWYSKMLSEDKVVPELLLITGCNVLSYANLLKGRFMEALDIHLHWKGYPESNFPAFGLVYSYCLEGLIHLHQGNIDNSERAFERAKWASIGRLGEFSIYSVFPTAFKAEVSYQQGNTKYLLEEVYPSLSTISQIGMLDSMLHSFPCVASALFSNGREPPLSG